MGRRVIHVDMDAFYASVEQRDRPELRGRPVIVGADPRGRGVVATASYEARAFGVRSAMPIGQAGRLCPHAVFLPVDMAKYAAVSARIMALLAECTPLLEPLSLDEAFLDVTASERLFGPAIEIARGIKRRIREEVGLTASAGVAPNKFLAKLASDLEKPDGLVEVPPGGEVAFLRDLPVARLWGVGRVVEAELRRMGVSTIGQLARLSRRLLVQRLGQQGAALHELAHGRDDRPVVPWEAPKSIGAEETFPRDISEGPRLRAVLLAQADRVGRELRDEGYEGRTVTLKVRFADFTTVTRSETGEPTADGSEIFRRAFALFERLPRPQPVRLIGLSVSGLAAEGSPRQLALFGGADKARRVARTVDDLLRRFGPGAVRRASLLPAKGPARLE